MQTCAICAWRATCNKKFSISDPSRCPEYTRDLTLPDPDEKDSEDDRSPSGADKLPSERNLGSRKS